MILRGVPAGAATPRADWNQTDPSMADFIKGKEQVEAAIAANTAQIARLPKLTLAIGDTVPEAGPVLWFNTAPRRRRCHGHDAGPGRRRRRL